MENKNFTVKKRNGETEIFSAEKVEQVVNWATEGVSSVSANTVCANAKIQLFDGISTKEIHQSVIDSAVGMICEKTPNYQYVAGRLVSYQLRKEVWGGKNPPKLLDFIKKLEEEIDRNQLTENFKEKVLSRFFAIKESISRKSAIFFLTRMGMVLRNKPNNFSPSKSSSRLLTTTPKTRSSVLKNRNKTKAYTAKNKTSTGVFKSWAFDSNF